MLIPEEPEDMWHAYNLVTVGDSVNQQLLGLYIIIINSKSNFGRVCGHTKAFGPTYPHIKEIVPIILFTSAPPWPLSESEG